MVSPFLIAGLVLFITGNVFSCLYSFNWLTRVSITEYSRDKTPKSPVRWSTYQSIKSLIFSYKHSLNLPMKSKDRFEAKKRYFQNEQPITQSTKVGQRKSCSIEQNRAG